MRWEQTAAAARAASAGRGGVFQRAFAHAFARQSWLLILAIVGAHLVFGLEEFPLIARALLAVPAVIFIVEARAYLQTEKRELPFLLLALLQFYVTFGFPVFFELPFFDLGGPVLFSDATRIQGALAVALGAASLWGASRFAMHLGRDLPRRALPILPPEMVGNAWDQAFYVYVGLTLAMVMAIQFAPTLIPGAISIVVGLTLTLEFTIGLASVKPPQRMGRWAGIGLVAIGMTGGLLGGQIEPLARTVMAYISAQWVATRRIALGLIAALVLLFLVIQPIKGRYRDQVWGYTARTGESVGVAGRLEAWENALASYFTESTQRKDEAPAVSRLSELGPVMHALVVVPSRIDYAYGATLAQILYAPIPRLIWPEKPTSRDEVAQHYAVIFGLQTQTGSDTTAVGMCLLVEGYWNFGWPGIALVCGAIGLLIGFQQRLFSGDHWALRSAGVAQLSTLTAGAPLVVVYGSVFQFAFARFLGVWIVYWLTQILGTKTRRAPVTRGATPKTPARAAGSDRGVVRG